MEKSQHRPAVAAHWDRILVYSRQHTFRMESIRTEFPYLDTWETSVTAAYLSAEIDDFLFL